MAWTIKINHSVERQLAKLDRVTRQRIVSFLREKLLLAENPRQLGKALKGPKATLWRYRVGDYRLICSIQDKQVTILVLTIGHRREVYR